MTSDTYSRYLLRTARRRARLSQTALAHRARTSQAAISAYESGRRSPSVATLARILEASGFELRMRLAEPDTHEASRWLAEQLLPAERLEAFTRAEQDRSDRARRPRRRA